MISRPPIGANTENGDSEASFLSGVTWMRRVNHATSRGLILGEDDR